MVALETRSAAQSMQDDVSQLRALAKEVYEQAGSKLGLSDIKELLAQGMLLLLKLKEDNRVATFQAEDEKEVTAKAKAEVEAIDLQLQNLVYEKQYYDKEIRNNRSFVSRYSDEQLGLDPPEVFLAELPPGVAAKAKAEEHAFMLARLQRELQQRKEMKKKLEAVQEEKAEVVAHKDKCRRKLDELATQLLALQQHALPLRTILAPPAAGIAAFSHAANLLPLPLYLIYSQLAAAKEALGLSVRVTITGVTADAEAFAANAAAAANVNGGASSSAAAAPAVDAAATTVEGPGGAAESGPASAAPAAVATGVLTSSSSVGGSRSKRARLASTGQEEGPYKAHPLTVVLEVLRSSNNGSSAPTAAPAPPSSMPPPAPRTSSTLLAVKFQWLLNLKLVTAHSDVPDDNALLAQLFPGDEGGGETFEAASQVLGGTSYDTTRAQRPYRWCQQLAGLDFVPPLPLATMLHGPEVEEVLKGLDLYRKEQRVVSLVQRLTALKEGSALASASEQK